MYRPNDNLTIMLHEYRWNHQPHWQHREKRRFNEKERWLLLGYYKPENQPYYESRKWFDVKHVSGLHSVIFADGDLRVSVKSASVKQSHKKLNRIVRRLYNKGLQS